MKHPVTTPLTVVKGDDGGSKMNMVCYERIGGVVFKLPEGLTPDLEVPWTSEEKAGLPCFLKGDRSEHHLTNHSDLAVGMPVLVPTLWGYTLGVVTELTEDDGYARDYGYTEEKLGSQYLLSFAQDGWDCWSSSCAMNLRALKRLKITR